MATEKKSDPEKKIAQPMQYARSTPGTHVYVTSGESDITTLYIKKSAFAKATPKQISLRVTWE